MYDKTFSAYHEVIGLLHTNTMSSYEVKQTYHHLAHTSHSQTPDQCISTRDGQAVQAIEIVVW